MTDIPRRAVTRTAKLAALPLGFAGRAALGLGKRVTGLASEVISAEVQQRTAEHLFSVLGQLKGGAMKLGQALSVFEAALPDELAGPYRAALTRLQEAAPPLPVATVHKVLASQLGPEWRHRFREFDETPAAAASIGQVHHAVWEDGREVAVKVQYPGAGKALVADLNQLSRLASMFRVLQPGLDVKPLLVELRARITEELDYELEAVTQAAFAEAFADDPEIFVPGVVASAPQMLVTEWVTGTPLSALIKDGSQEARDDAGRRIAVLHFSAPARAGLLHADPHPGNFRVLPTPDGSLGGLGIVDFGAVARLPERSLPHSIGSLLRIASYDDYDDVLEGLRDEGFVKPNIRVDPDELREYLSPFVEPARTETFAFSREWMRAQFQRLQDPRQPGSALVLRLNLPPSYLLIHRVWVGSIGVLSQLEAELPFRAILEESLPGFAEA